ncbi:tripartite tricarboxylate transporter substrate binding protein [Bordetella tumulicola]
MAFPLIANADSFPTRTIRIVVSVGAGSGGDTTVRYVADLLQEKLKVPVIVENKPGADSWIATQSVLQAPADGYSIILTSLSLVTVPFTNEAAKYDPMEDIIPIGMTSRTPAMIVTSENSRFKSLDELLGESKENSNSINFAAYANSYRIGVKYFEKISDSKFTLINYKAFGQVINDLMGQTIDAALVDGGAALPLIRSGRLRALAIAGDQRLGSLPEVPTVREILKKDYELFVWTGFGVKKGTPADVIKKLKSGLAEVFSMGEYKDYFRKNRPESDNVGNTGKYSDDYYRNEISKYRKIIKSIEL